MTRLSLVQQVAYCQFFPRQVVIGTLSHRCEQAGKRGGRYGDRTRDLRSKSLLVDLRCDLSRPTRRPVDGLETVEFLDRETGLPEELSQKAEAKLSVLRDKGPGITGLGKHGVGTLPLGERPTRLLELSDRFGSGTKP